MVFSTNRKLLLVPALLGGLNVAFGAIALIARAGSHTMRLDLETVGAILLVAMGTFFVQVAWRLSRYEIETTDSGLAIGPDKHKPGHQLNWSEITGLEREEVPARGRRGPSIVYRVQAGKRQLAFTSLLFEQHAALADQIAGRTRLSWKAPEKA